MKIDFTKNYYRKDFVKEYITDGPEGLFPKKQKIVSMQTLVGLEDYPRSVFSINELVSEDDLETFIEKVLKEQKKRSEEIKIKN